MMSACHYSNILAGCKYWRWLLELAKSAAFIHLSLHVRCSYVLFLQRASCLCSGWKPARWRKTLRSKNSSAPRKQHLRVRWSVRTTVTKADFHIPSQRKACHKPKKVSLHNRHHCPKMMKEGCCSLRRKSNCNVVQTFKVSCSQAPAEWRLETDGEFCCMRWMHPLGHTGCFLDFFLTMAFFAKLSVAVRQGAAMCAPCISSWERQKQSFFRNWFRKRTF